MALRALPLPLALALALLLPLEAAVALLSILDRPLKKDIVRCTQ